MKIIFLDFDGVLNDQLSLEKYYQKNNYNNDYINYKMVARLNKIIEATNAKIVISSTWRCYYTLDELVKNYLIPNGFIGEVIGETKVYFRIGSWLKTKPRAEEIQHWLDNNKDKNIESFVILDDDESCLVFEDNFVQTFYYSVKENDNEEYFKEGRLQDEHVDKAIKILNNTFIGIERTSEPAIDISKARFTSEDYIELIENLIDK